MLIKPGRRAMWAVVLLLAQAGVYYTVSAKETIPEIAPWSQFPATVNGWKTVSDTPLDHDVLAALQPDDYLNREYAAGNNRAVSLFIGYFSSRRDGRAPHSPEWCLPGAGWKPVSTRVVQIPTAGGREPLPANEYIVDKSADRALVLYWYHQGEHVMASEVLAQFFAIPDMLIHGRTDTSLVRIIAPVPTNEIDNVRRTTFEFARDAYPLIRQQIR